MRDPGSRLMKLRLKLEEYDFSISYEAGKQNCNADAPSRIFEVNAEYKNYNEFYENQQNTIIINSRVTKNNDYVVTINSKRTSTVLVPKHKQTQSNLIHTLNRNFNLSSFIDNAEMGETMKCSNNNSFIFALLTFNCARDDVEMENI